MDLADCIVDVNLTDDGVPVAHFRVGFAFNFCTIARWHDRRVAPTP